MTTAARHLTYPGDVSDEPPFTVGPDLFGGMWRSVSADYNPETNQTRVGFVPYYVPAGAPTTTEGTHHE